ncbi:MAG: LysM peptidoglycan-binding domain-containing protein [Gammaproteobacteria bacterium]|nr:LysM peptidoglycan-binding domain-containing protein [Gammaproteobacteria bacterium]
MSGGYKPSSLRLPVLAVLALALALALSGCGMLPSRGGPEATVTGPATGAAPAPSPPAAADHPPPTAHESPLPPPDLWTRLRGGFRLTAARHDRIRQQTRHWQERGRHLTTVSERAEPFLHFIVSRVEDRDMPGEVALVPFVESAFDPHARSYLEAAGLWQFMPATARHFGLRSDWWYDARRDVVASTGAALDYLEYLNDLFDGDWLLALAAYNAGEGTVRRAMERNRFRGLGTDYWSLELPRETETYVPRILGLARVLAAPERHGVRLHPIDNRPRLAVVDLEAAVEMELAAELSGLDAATVRDLNPGYLRWASAPDGPHYLVMPADRADALRRALARTPSARWVRWHRHRVRRGDSLYVIARRYGTSVDTLMRLNGMSGHLLAVGRDLKVPRAPGTTASAPAGAATTRAYTVRSGDSLWAIARRFNVRVHDLTRWNDLSRDTVLRPGQVLALRPPTSTA